MTKVEEIFLVINLTKTFSNITLELQYQSVTQYFEIYLLLQIPFLYFSLICIESLDE